MHAFQAIIVVKEKENVIIERFGKFKVSAAGLPAVACVVVFVDTVPPAPLPQAQLTPGVHCILPWVDRPKNYTVRFYVANALGNTELVHRTETRIHTQNEVLDFPKQAVITRDNAMCVPIVVCCLLVNVWWWRCCCATLHGAAYRVVVRKCACAGFIWTRW